MYTNYNIPQNRYNNARNYRVSNNYQPSTSMNYPNNQIYNDGDRFFGGGFLGPLLLGGVGGYLLGRPNYGYNQGPIPVYFPPQQMPYYPPYSNTNIYY